MPLNTKELSELADLLAKVDDTQIKGEVWHKLIQKFMTVAVELCILDGQDRVFLARRSPDDMEFPGRPYHMPGTVVNDWEKVKEAILRLIKNEIQSAGLEITEPEPIGWVEVSKGKKMDRHEIGLLHIAHFRGTFPEREDMGFFPINNLPKDIINSHIFLIEKFKEYLKNGKPILGK